MSNSRIPSRGPSTDHSTHFLQCLVLPSSGSEPVGAVEKILLIDGVQYFHHRLLHDLVLQSGNRDRSLLPILFRYVDPAERLGLVLPLSEPLVKRLDISLGVLLVLLIRDAVHPCAGILS